MQNFELVSLAMMMMMMENHDLLTCWLAPQVKREGDREGGKEGVRGMKYDPGT